jgi:hypothetical protein
MSVDEWHAVYCWTGLLNPDYNPVCDWQSQVKNVFWIWIVNPFCIVLGLDLDCQTHICDGFGLD